MQIEEGTIEGDYELSSELKMLGMFSGDVTVKDGGHLILYGIAAKDIIIEAGGTVEVNGMIKGKVANNGGTLTVSPGAFVGG